MHDRTRQKSNDKDALGKQTTKRDWASALSISFTHTRTRTHALTHSHMHFLLSLVHQTIFSVPPSLSVSLSHPCPFTFPPAHPRRAARAPAPPRTKLPLTPRCKARAHPRARPPLPQSRQGSRGSCAQQSDRDPAGCRERRGVPVRRKRTVRRRR